MLSIQLTTGLYISLKLQSLCLKQIALIKFIYVNGLLRRFSEDLLMSHSAGRTTSKGE